MDFLQLKELLYNNKTTSLVAKFINFINYAYSALWFIYTFNTENRIKFFPCQIQDFDSPLKF